MLSRCVPASIPTALQVLLGMEADRTGPLQYRNETLIAMSNTAALANYGCSTAVADTL